MFTKCGGVLVSFLSFHALTSTAVEYVGLTPCPSNSSIIGYTNTTQLNEDIVADMKHIFDGGAPQDYYHYILCPDTTFNIGTNFTHEQDGETPIVPGISNTIFSCGPEGSLSSNCVLSGGSFHFYFADFVIVETVIISGFTFEGVEGASIYGDAHPQSHVIFQNCAWKGNKGGSTFYVHYTPPENFRQLAIGEPYDLDDMKEKMKDDFKALMVIEPNEVMNWDGQRNLQENYKYSMSTVVVDSEFKDNVDNVATIFSFGGAVELIGTTFTNNDVEELGVFTVLGNGHAFIHGESSFSNNNARLGPVFIDSTSYLHLSRDNSGSSNAGGLCDGIFLESDTSLCFDPTGPCDGQCCAFGDETCDLYDADTPSAAPSALNGLEPKAPPQGGSTATTSNTASGATLEESKKDGGCGGFCMGFSIVFPIFIVSIFALTCIILRRRKLRKDIEREIETIPPNEKPTAIDAEDKQIT